MKKALKWAGILVLCGVGLVGGTLVKNNAAHRRQLRELLAFSQPAGLVLLDSVSYVSAAQSGCYFFMGAAFCTPDSIPQVVEAFSGSFPSGELREHLTFVWAVGDSFVIQPWGLGRVISAPPLSLAFLGGDADRGIQQLWASGRCKENRLVVLTNIQRPNFFDYRCY